MSASLCLADMIEDLSIDSVRGVNTKLAEDYLKKHNSEFQSLGKFEECQVKFKKDDYGNKISCIDFKQAEKISHLRVEDRTSSFPLKNLSELAKQVTENAELFCQLENLIRGLSKHHVKNCDINLIVKNIEYCCSLVHNDEPLLSRNNHYLVIDDQTPLAMIGYLAQMFLTSENLYIVSTINTAVVCHLFTLLCHKVGLTYVYLILVEEAPDIGVRFDLDTTVDVLPRLRHCCTGVITEKSDLDSAVHEFVNSTAMRPWKLQRVLIEESIYETYKKVLAWKCRSEMQSGDNQVANLKSKCTDIYSYNNKLFLVDYVGNPDDINARDSKQQIVFIEAYRTVKELLSLVKKYGVYSISLWCSDISQANEIAYGVNAAMVWINEYGVVEGPSKVSQAFYPYIYIENSLTMLKHDVSFETLWKIRQQWLKIDEEKRRVALIDVLKNSTHRASEFASYFDSVTNWDMDRFIEIKDGKISVGLDEPLDIIIHDFKSKKYIAQIFRSMVNGNVIVSLDSSDYKDILSDLAQAGLPVLCTNTKTEYHVNNAFIYKTKVIWTNFGTIFAN